MKLGVETGSLVNHMMADSKQPKPDVGMGATLLHWTDRIAGTVIGVSYGLKGPIGFIVQEDRVRRTDSNGMSETQAYEYQPNPDGAEWHFTLRKNGAWILKGKTPRNAGLAVSLGHRRAYHDYSF